MVRLHCWSSFLSVTLRCVVLQMLVVFRNPKDTLVSYYHFCNNNPVLPRAESWDSFYSDFMKGDGESNMADV